MNTIDRNSDATKEECAAMIGKKVAEIKAEEYGFTMIFDDGSSVEIRGGRWDGCCLGVEYDKGDS